MKKLLSAVSVLSLSLIPLSSLAADKAVVDLYNKTCVVCHAAGAAGAPKTGDAAQWASRTAKGMDAMVTAVDKGMGAMPPKGMCFDCTTDDFKALIEYMVDGK